ncbi:MAG: hypothetical protein AAGH43_09465 [Pseudomonadota bacterium]
MQRPRTRLRSPSAPDDVTRLLRYGGLVACFASATVFAADLLLLGGALQPDQPNVMHIIPTKPDWMVFWGHTLGVLFIPVCLTGMILVWHGLRPAGFWVATLITFGLATLFAVGPFIHGMYAPIGALIGVRDQLGEPLYTRLMDGHGTYFAGPLMPTIILLMLASLAFSLLVLMGRTAFPRWLGLWSLGPMMLLFVLSPRYLPAGLAGIVSPACVHMAYLPFISFVTWWMWNGPPPAHGDEGEA